MNNDENEELAPKPEPTPPKDNSILPIRINDSEQIIKNSTDEQYRPKRI
jgi:hypothetical protein